MRVAVVVYPGTNCDTDTQHAFELLGCDVVMLWHKEEKLPDGTDLVVLPGGFSYGDYLRCGGIAKFAPITKAIIDYAQKGGKVLGICNGFQVLLELKLLPGAMIKNKNVHFISKYQRLKVIDNDNDFLRKFALNDIVNIPIAHGEGNYFIDEAGLAELKRNNQILLTYCDKDGNADNPNGSLDDIAGICNVGRNIFGLMPHPERAMQDILGSSDGAKMLQGFIEA
jgi:phosphoribosylformylglycinamidine synthase